MTLGSLVALAPVVGVVVTKGPIRDSGCKAINIP